MNISILITTYNAAHYIIETMESISSQTYMAYEIVIVDDGSTDTTVKLLKDFILQKNLKNVSLILSTHIGRARSLLLGIQHSQYDWIAIIDADDLWHQKKLEYQVTLIKSHHIDCLFTECISFSDSKNLKNNYISNKKKHLLKQITLNTILFGSTPCHSSVLMKKEIAKYNEKLQKQIDLDLWLFLLTQHKNLYIVLLPLSYHRIHENQSFESQKRVTYVINSAKTRLKYAIMNKKYIAALLVLFRPLAYIFKKLK